ncbi:MAG: hypothetical protein JSV23_08725 [Promethearchaeota archaeon]|nr:MAG: hypothetical protein JSV23_08725 [Candidatus Lokiarchaeota archaeon]
MAEDQTEPIEEKEEKRKIRVISQIDDLIGIQGQAYIIGQLKDALAYANQIIELAKTEDLKSFIREQEELIAKIEKLLKEKEEKERKRLSAEQERLRLEKIKKLKTELNQLERSFIAGFIAEDFLKTEKTIDKAKNLLSDLDDTESKSKWQDFERRHIEAKTKKELIEKAQKIIEESIELKEKFLFDDLKLKLIDIIKQLKNNGISEHLIELEYIQKDAINAEKTYLNVVQTIDKLIKEINTLQESKNFKSAISKCDNLLKLAESIKKDDLIETYLKTLTKLQKDLSFQELKETVGKLNQEGLSLLKKGEIKLSIEKFKMIKGSINYYLEET